MLTNNSLSSLWLILSHEMSEIQLKQCLNNFRCRMQMGTKLGDYAMGPWILGRTFLNLKLNFFLPFHLPERSAKRVETGLTDALIMCRFLDAGAMLAEGRKGTLTEVLRDSHFTSSSMIIHAQLPQPCPVLCNSVHCSPLGSSVDVGAWKWKQTRMEITLSLSDMPQCRNSMKKSKKSADSPQNPFQKKKQKTKNIRIKLLSIILKTSDRKTCRSRGQ